MNDVAGSETIANLLADPALSDAATEETPTFGWQNDKGERMDFVLPDLHFDVKAYTVVDSNASDHRPVVVDLEFA